VAQDQTLHIVQCRGINANPSYIFPPKPIKLQSQRATSRIPQGALLYHSQNGRTGYRP